MFKDIVAEIKPLKLTLIKCKDCDQVVQKNTTHLCKKTNMTSKVKLGAHVPDKFYKDRGLDKD